MDDYSNNYCINSSLGFYYEKNLFDNETIINDNLDTIQMLYLFCIVP